MEEEFGNDGANGENVVETDPTGSKPPQWVIDIIKYAAEDPWGFVSTLFLYLSPFFLISAFLSWKLAQMIEDKEKGKKKASVKSKNKRNTRRKQD